MVVIILTTTVNVQDKCYLYQMNPLERLNDYLKSIGNWIQKTSLKIIVVENSGYPFNQFKNDNRFEIISFDESQLPEAGYLKGNSSKGASELFSINYAIKNSKLITPDDFIIKITGRYFIPEFEEYLSKINLDFDAVIQSDRGSCEMLGCKRSQVSHLFNTHDILNGEICNHIEFLYKIRISTLNKVMIFKKFIIEGTQMGGANVIRYSL